MRFLIQCQRNSLRVLLLTTFVAVLSALTYLLGLYHSPCYTCYIWLRHNWLSTEDGTRSDTSLYEQLLNENDERIVDSQFFLSTLPEKSSDIFNKRGLSKGSFRNSEVYASYSENLNEYNKKLQVLIMLISSGRQVTFKDGQAYDPYFLTQNVASFGQILLQRKIESQIRYSLVICSVGDGNMTAEEYELNDLATVYRKLQSGTIFGPYHDVLAWPFEKERLDYIFCLQKGLKTYSDYILMVEDDAVPRSESLAVIDNFIFQRRYIRNRDSHFEKHSEVFKTLSVKELKIKTSLVGRVDQNSSISSIERENEVDRCEYDIPKHPGAEFYAKLYHPKRLQGYISWETERLLQLFAITIFIGSFIHVYRNKMRTEGRHIGSYDWVCCCTVIGLVCLVVGRPHVETWRRLVSPYAHSVVPDVHCCTQAILYTALAAHDVVSHLKQQKCSEAFHKDDALWSYTVKTRQRGDHMLSKSCLNGKSLPRMKSFLVQPNLFEHIGFWSSTRQDFIDPHLILE